MATRGLLAKGEYWERLAIMGKLIYRNTRSSLQQTWAKTSYHMQKIRDNADCAEQEYASLVLRIEGRVPRETGVGVVKDVGILLLRAVGIVTNPTSPALPSFVSRVSTVKLRWPLPSTPLVSLPSMFT
jgi:hypothetical protein